MSSKSVLSRIYLNTAKTAWAPIQLNGTPQQVSLATSFTSPSINVLYQDNISFQINITTSNSTGTFYVQVSDDNSNWVDMGIAGTVAAANDVILCEVGTGARMFTRLRYESTVAGTGTASIIATAKNLGA